MQSTFFLILRIFSGLVLLQEAQQYRVEQLLLVALGTIVALSGVWVLTVKN